MRTNIVIDDELMQRAQSLTGIQTKRQVVEEALRLLIQMYDQAQLRDLRGQLTWEGNLDEMREGRFEPAG
jgi:Arc/MetJ family transcription regulator